MTDRNDDQCLEFSLSQRVATITLKRPDAANGLSLELTRELAAVALRCDADPRVKAVVITANGKMFCAGGDINAIKSGGASLGENVKVIADELHKAISLFARMDAPVITAVNGTAAGAGFSLAMIGDMVLASDKAKFTMAYTKIGLSPDGSSSYYLPRLVGLRKAQELMFTNRLLSASEAQDWGLVNEVVEHDKLADRAQGLAQQIASGSLSSHAMVKKLLLATFDNSLETQMELEGRGIAACANTQDGEEGVNSFLEKRQPTFS